MASRAEPAVEQARGRVRVESPQRGAAWVAMVTHPGSSSSSSSSKGGYPPALRAPGCHGYLLAPSEDPLSRAPAPAAASLQKPQTPGAVSCDS